MTTGGVDIPLMIAQALHLGDSVNGWNVGSGGLVMTMIILGIVVVALLALKADMIVTLVMTTIVTAVLWTMPTTDPVTSFTTTWAPYWLLIIEFFALIVTLAFTLTHGGNGGGGE